VVNKTQKKRKNTNYVPITEGFSDPIQDEFLKLRDKKVDNVILRKTIRQKRRGDKLNMKFGAFSENKDLYRASKHVKAIRDKKFQCNDSSCDHNENPGKGVYELIWHSKEIPHSNTGNNIIDSLVNEMCGEIWGRKIRSNFHIAVKCGKCGKFIKFVKYTLGNRLAAGDETLQISTYEEQSYDK
jgi:hypothetical protein